MKVIVIVLISLLLNTGLCAGTENKQIEPTFSTQELQGMWIKQNCLSTKLTIPLDICKMKYHAYKFKNYHYIEYLSDKKKRQRNYLTFKLIKYAEKNWLQLNVFNFKSYYEITKVTENTKIKIENTVINFKKGDMILSMYNSKKEVVNKIHYHGKSKLS